MPKRSLDVANMGHATKIVNKKTERSHEENQERAYIAASRRADRSIEARVQSARMASEIHKKRTGKAFRITEEIVTKEEMYEEEEDDFPRSYRILGPHMQTASAEMNSRVDAYLSNRVAMSQLLSATEANWRDNEINRTFAHFFPQADRQAQSISQRWSTPGFPMPRSQNDRMSSTSEQSEPNFQSVNYDQQNSPEEQHQSRAPMSPTAEVKNEGVVSPPALTPSSHPETPQSVSTSVFANTMPPLMEGSAFTAELPAEAKMLMGGMGLDDTFNPGMFGDAHNWGVPTQSYTFEQPKYLSKEEEVDFGFGGGDRYPDSFEPVNWGPGYATPTKTSVEEPSWDVFLNDNWNDQQQQQQ